MNTTIFATVVDDAVALGVLIVDLEALNLSTVSQAVPPLVNDGAAVATSKVMSFRLSHTQPIRSLVTQMTNRLRREREFRH